MLEFFLNYICPIIAVVSAFSCGWMIRGASKKTYGTMHVVSFDDGTVDMLIEIKSKPENLINGQELIFTVNKTRG